MKEKKIYVNLPKLDNIQAFIVSLFCRKIGYGGFLVKKTYNDPDFTDKECNSARRSFEDLYRIVKTVYEDITEEEFAIHLYNVSITDHIQCFICNDIKKVVFQRNNTHQYGTYRLGYGGTFDHPLLSVGFGIDFKGHGKYSLKDILDLMGFKDNYEIANGEKQLNYF